MQPIHDLLFMPEHHVALAWWIALLSPLWLPQGILLLKRLPVWGERLRQARINDDIVVLERLHNNSNGLIIYLAFKAILILYEVAYASLLSAMMAANAHTIPLRSIVFATGLSLGCGMAGTIWRVRSMLTKLVNYETALSALKSERDRYRAKHGIAS
jgi:hypothetical protein